MNIKAIKDFALYARCEMDKTNLSPVQKKEAFVSMIMQRLNNKTEKNSLEENIIPEYIIQKFSSDISSEELSHVETIGWLYQYFVNPDRKEAIDSIGGHDLTDDEISVATQVFTPEWIVKFLVDNSLGRFLKETTGVDMHLEYGLNSFSCRKKDIDITKVTFFDPSCGSGHILVYAFDVFMKMYLSLGYTAEEGARSIITNNLYGADIDPLAVELCNFQLMLKMSEYGVNCIPNIYLLDSSDAVGSLRFDNSHPLLKRKFTIVCTNPPYLANVGGETKKYINEYMKPYSKDLYTAFMYRGLCYCEDGGYMAYMTPNSWMFLSSHKGIREYILQNKTICSLVLLGKGAYFSEASVDICAFVIKNDYEDKDGVFIRLEDFPKNLHSQNIAALDAISAYNSNKNCPYLYKRNRDYFCSISEKPLSFWVDENVYGLFNEKTIGNAYVVKQGMTTGNNKRFLKYWFKVPFDLIGFGMTDSQIAKNSGKKWFPYNKGGKFRKWYGNNEYVVMYENDGEEIKEYTSHLNQGTWVRLKSRDYYFKESVTWSFISSSHFGVRYSPCGSIFDVAGSSLFGDDLMYVLAFLSSKTAFYLLQMINSSMNYQIRDVRALPFIMDASVKNHIENLAVKCIEETKLDWDSTETSYGFKTDPLLEISMGNISLNDAVSKYMDVREKRFSMVLEMEKEINHIFSRVYNVEKYIDCNVTPRDITLFNISAPDAVKNLVSYLVGCTFGRYTIEKNGVQSCKKTSLSIDSIEKTVLDLVKKQFSNTDGFLAYLGRNSLGEYLKKDFIKNHIKQYHKHPIYFKDGDNILYDIEKE